MAHPPLWTKDRLNILSPDNISKINFASETGIIFGLHGYCYGGSSASSWAYSNINDFLEDVSKAKPGDYYVVWSTKELEAKNLVLFHGTYNESDSTPFSQTDLEIFQNYLSKKYNEVFVIFRNGNLLEVKLNDLDYTNDDLLEDIEYWYKKPGEELYIFPFADIDKPEYILVEAKKPNENGEVPIGGAY